MTAECVGVGRGGRGVVAGVWRRSLPGIFCTKRRKGHGVNNTTGAGGVRGRRNEPRGRSGDEDQRGTSTESGGEQTDVRRVRAAVRQPASQPNSHDSFNNALGLTEHGCHSTLLCSRIGCRVWLCCWFDGLQLALCRSRHTPGFGAAFLLACRSQRVSVVSTTTVDNAKTLRIASGTVAARGGQSCVPLLLSAGTA